MITLFEGFKDNINKKIILNKKLSLYIPGTFIIICLDRWSSFIRNSSTVLFLLKNIRNEHVESYDVEHNIKHYAIIKILDYISLDKQDIDIGSETNIDIEDKDIEILFKVNSEKDAINKFEELKKEYPYKDWVIKNDMEKYNI
jgi:hypothetical protein